MITETMDTTLTSPNSSTALNGNVVQRVAQKAHQTVDKLEQTVVTGSEKVMTLQEEYGSYARQRIKANPLGTVAGAFAVGFVLAKILR